MLRTAVVIAVAAVGVVWATHAMVSPDPAQTTLGDAECKDLSGRMAMFPQLQDDFPDLEHTPVVEYHIQTALGAPSMPYAFKINGETKSSGEIGPGGLLNSSTPIPNSRSVTVEVTSDGKVLASRTYRPDC